MAQASVRWWRLVKQCQRYVSDFVSFNRLAFRRLRHEKRSVIGLALLMFLLWNWQLVVAIALGLGIAVTVFMVQQRRVRLTVPLPLWHSLWHRANRGLTLAIATGSLSCLSVYMVLQVWADADSVWLALALTLAQFGLWGVAVALALHVAQAAPETDSTGFDRLLNALTQADPLKRLIAIRQATRWVLAADVKGMSVKAGRSPHTPSQRQMRTELIDCFRVMLSRETDPILCHALVDGLDALNATQRLAPAQAEMQFTPASVKTQFAPEPVRRDSFPLP